MRTTWYLLTLLLACVASCHDAGTDIPEFLPVPFENVEQSGGFRVPEAGTVVMRQDSAWLRYWREYWRYIDGSGKKTPPPPVDFSRQMVVAVFYGGGSSGGDYSGCRYDQDVIQGIWKSRTSVTVRVGPLPFLGYCDQMIMPLQMVTIPKSDLEVVFVGNLPK